MVVLPTEEENSQEEGLGQAQPGARWTRAGKEGLGQAQPGARWTRAGIDKESALTSFGENQAPELSPNHYDIWVTGRSQIPRLPDSRHVAPKPSLHC